jgi:hypothetical protein
MKYCTVKLEDIDKTFKEHSEEYDSDRKVDVGNYNLFEIFFGNFKRVELQNVDMMVDEDGPMDLPEFITMCPCGCNEVFIVKLLTRKLKKLDDDLREGDI